MKKRTVALLAAMAVALIAASGAAMAATISFSVGQPYYGTDHADTMTLAENQPYNYKGGLLGNL